MQRLDGINILGGLSNVTDNLLFQLCPATIAPNILTFSGFLLTVANFVLLSIYDPHYYASSDDPPGDQYLPVPSLVWIACAVNHFLAHTLGEIMIIIMESFFFL